MILQFEYLRRAFGDAVQHHYKFVPQVSDFTWSCSLLPIFDVRQFGGEINQLL